VVGLFILGMAAAFAWGGYRHGLVRQGIQLGALVLAILFAKPVSASIPVGLPGIRNTPRLLQPVATQAVAALLVMLIAVAVGRLGVLALSLGQDKDEAKRRSARDRRRGAGLGAVKGLLYALIALVIVHNLGQVAEITTEHAGKRGAQIRSPCMGRSLIKAKKAIDRSTAAGIVKLASPIDEEVFVLLADLLDIANDAAALKRLQQHPDLQPLLGNPRILALAQDEGIIQAAKDREFLAILNNENVADAVGDPELRAELKRLDAAAIIQAVKGDTDE